MWLGWDDVKSYIASGNLVFRAAGRGEVLAAELRAAMARVIGVDVPVLVLEAREIADALDACPFAPEKGNLCHAFFLWSEPVVDYKTKSGTRVVTLQLDGEYLEQIYAIAHDAAQRYDSSDRRSRICFPCLDTYVECFFAHAAARRFLQRWADQCSAVASLTTIPQTAEGNSPEGGQPQSALEAQPMDTETPAGDV